MHSLKIIYQDENLVAINKPNGLLVHPSSIAARETEFANRMLEEQLGQKVFTVHRLDRPTSGILLFALDIPTAQKMNQVFVDGLAKKDYLAVVRGFTAEQATIDYALRTDKDAPAKEAVTKYHTLARTELPIAVSRYPSSRYSLVHAMPLTGRMHQIRKHFAHIRHYIIGDKTHGDWRHNTMFAENFNAPTMLLHAFRLQFPHPNKLEIVTINASPPDTYHNVLQSLQWISIWQDFLNIHN